MNIWLILKTNIDYVYIIIYHILKKLYAQSVKLKKSAKCDECNITASYNFEKLRPLKCLEHRKTGMINIKRNHTLCEKHDISHSKKTECKICKLDIDSYYNSTNYMKEKYIQNLKMN